MVKRQNHLHAPHKRLTLALRTHTGSKWTKIFYASGNQQRTGIAILISQKKHTLSQNSNRRRLLYKDKGINSSRRSNNVSIHALNMRVPEYIKQILTDLKGNRKQYSNKRVLNIPLSIMDKSSGHKNQ